MVWISECRSNGLLSFAFKNKQLLYPVEQRNVNVPSLHTLDVFLKELKKHCLVNQREAKILIYGESKSGIQRVFRKWLFICGLFSAVITSWTWEMRVEGHCNYSSSARRQGQTEHWRLSQQYFLSLLLSSFVLFFFLANALSCLLSFHSDGCVHWRT